MKLTNWQRDKIIAAAIASKFQKQEKDFIKREDALARKAYNHLFDEGLRRKIKSMPDKWFQKCGSMRFNVGGQQHYLQLSENKMLPTPYESHCALLGVLDGAIGDEVRAFANEKEQAKTDKRTAEAKLKSLLYSISTLKRLKELWPEGAEFYKGMDEDAVKGGLPALRFDDVNQLLGIKA
jgi:Nucleotide modification associated domain 5